MPRHGRRFIRYYPLGRPPYHGPVYRTRIYRRYPMGMHGRPFMLYRIFGMLVYLGILGIIFMITESAVIIPLIFIGIITLVVVFTISRSRNNTAPTQNNIRPNNAGLSPENPNINNTQSAEPTTRSSAVRPENIGKVYCPYCGAKIRENVIYCPECGTRLN